MKRPALALLPLALFLFAAHAAADAPAPQPVRSSADSFHGSVGASVPIEVPPFHAIEPRLTLDYGSSGGNGLAGVGFGLNGFSTIERQSSGGGAPTYTASDVFRLDGQELVACTAGSKSPSCTTGGTHSTKIESFVRIARDTTANTWTVTQKDGTRAIYGAVYDVSQGTFRWGLKSVVDTSGNTVTYGWWCDAGADCYPSTVTYGPNVVTLYRESRPDPVSFANGSTLGKTSYRIKTIDVTVSGSRARAYALSYTTSAATSRSLLASVQIFGSDATLDASGRVTGGTAQPAMTVTRQAAAPGRWSVAASTGTAGNTGFFDYGISLTTGDFNGDGKVDVLTYNSTTLNWEVSLWNGHGWTVGGNTVTSGNAGFFDYGSSLVTGDFDGDGKTDVLTYNSTTANWEVSLWNGTGWTVAASTGTAGNAGFFDYGVTLTTGDFNGDGKTDVLTYNSSTGNWEVSLWNGRGWTVGGNTVTAGSAGFFDYGVSLTTGDFNGDGKTDVLTYNSSTGNWEVSLWNGSGWTVGGNTVTAGNTGFFDYGVSLTTGDFNSDGKTDVLTYNSSTANWEVSLWNGKSWTVAGSTGTAGNNGFFEYGISLQTGDFNGDGRTDVMTYNATTGNWEVSLWNGSGWSVGGNTVTAGTTGFFDYGVTLVPGDFDGDGRTDVLTYNASGGNWEVSLWAPGPLPDLVTSIANGLGGTTTFAYTPSSAWPNTNDPPIVQTISAITTSDGRGNSSTTSYTYAGGLFDAPSRRFLGFHYTKQTLPCIGGETACPYEETWYAQDYGSQSKPQEVRRSTGAGVLLTDTKHVYATNGATIPYVSIETGAWQYTYDGSGVSCAWPATSGSGTTCAHGARTYLSRVYDVYDPSTNAWKAGYGNLVQETAYGEYDVAGDEITTSYLAVPNAASYVVSKLAAQSSYAGVGTSGALLRQSLMYYDGASDWNVAPSVGKPTRGLKWSSTTNAYVSTSASYDAWGSVISETNEVGATTTYTLDSTYHQYLVAVTNALGQTSTVSWDPVCAKQLSETDANGQSMTMSYDALCRLTQTNYPLGGFETRSYVNVGNPSAGYVQIETPSADGAGNQWTRTYVDGVGRPWRTVTKGPSSTQSIQQDTEFNARGKTARQSAPYYSGETPQWLTSSYDALDRIVAMTAPDNTVVAKSYGFDQGYGSVLTTDELGHPQRDTLDAYGRPKWHYEWIGGAVTTRSYAYDARGNPTSITDGLGNVSTFTYDSLDRKLASYDPDAGAWSYAYDAAGRVVSQTDALGQTTTLVYDALGRRTSKTSLAGTAAATTVGWTYDQPMAGYSNVGRLTGVSDPSGGAAYGYDAAGRLVAGTRTIDGVDYGFQKGFDAAGRLLWTSYPDGDAVGTPSAPLTYDGAGRLKAIPGVVAAASYDARGQLTQQVNANGTTTTRSYSSSRFWLTGISTSSSGATIQSLAFARDAEGKVTEVASPFASEGWSFAYDQHRLASATNASNGNYSQSWTYDAYGNITSSSRLGAYVYAAAGQPHPHAVLSAGANTYAYDANGDMVSGAGRTIAYDGDNRPVSINGVRFAYDADGSRIKKVNGSTTTYYVSDDYEVTYGVTTKYVSLAGVPVARRVGATTYWLHTDQNGTIQAETDANGVEVLRQKFDGYGNTIESSGSLAESRGYTAQRQDETGLVYLHARYYDPSLARFISPDPTVPVGAMVGLNRYAYAGNDPINHTDVNGLSWLSGVFDGIGHFFSQVGHELSKIWHGVVSLVTAAVHGDIRAIASIVVIAVVAVCAPELLASGVGALTGAEVTAATVTAVATTSFGAAAAYVATSAAIGFATSFTVASINGASFSQALQAGISGAIVSAGLAAVNLAAKSFASYEDGQREARGIQTESHTGLESKSFSPKGSDGTWFHEDGALGHSAVGKFLNQVGYSASHDGFCRALFDNTLGKLGTLGQAADTALTVATNFGPYEVFYGAALIGGNASASVTVVGLMESADDADRAAHVATPNGVLATATMRFAPAQ